MGTVMDFVASRVSGLVNAKDCRIVWSEGTLYIIKTPSDILALQTEEPKKSAGSYKVRVGEAAIRAVPPGCGSCRKRVMTALGWLTLDDIKSRAKVLEDA